MKPISRHDSHLAAPAATRNDSIARRGFRTQPYWRHAVFPRPPDLCGGRKKAPAQVYYFFFTTRPIFLEVWEFV
jgi:hypothetical protein